VVSSQKGHILI